MIHLIKGKKIQEEAILFPLDKEICIELGCGDGRSLYRLAKNDPETFYIGIDSNEKGLEDISIKINKKPAKGGLPNIIFLKESAEDLPEELNHSADQIQINFPWGSLLSGVLTDSNSVLDNLLKIAKNNTILTILLTYNEKFEDSYIKDRALPELNYEFIDKDLRNLYKAKNIIIENIAILSDDEKANLQSSWAKKILSKRNREIFQIDCIINNNF